VNQHTMSCIPRAVHRLPRPASLRDGAYEAIVDMIVERVLRPGQHLRESELAQLLGVSRQPVREALQLCQSEGWVELYNESKHGPGGSTKLQPVANLPGMSTASSSKPSRWAMHQVQPRSVDSIWNERERPTTNPIDTSDQST
jgi:DNA-binding transcriptional MocR family regulator